MRQRRSINQLEERGKAGGGLHRGPSNVFSEGRRGETVGDDQKYLILGITERSAKIVQTDSSLM